MVLEIRLSLAFNCTVTLFKQKQQKYVSVLDLGIFVFQIYCISLKHPEFVTEALGS